MLQRLGSLVAKARGSTSKSFIAEFLRYGSSTGFVQLARVSSGLVVAALVDPVAWGNWYLLNLIIAYGAVTQLGALNGMNREVPAAIGRDDLVLARQLRTSALGLVLLTNGAASVMLIVSALVVPGWRPSNEFLLTIVLLLATQLFTYAVTSLRSTTNFNQLSRLQVFQAIIYPLLSIAGAALFGVSGFIIGQALALGALALATLGSGTVLWRPKLDLRVSSRLIRIGFPIMLVGLIHTLFATVDRWIVAGNLGSAALGHYSLAIMALNAVALLPQVISQQFYPRLAYAWSANKDAGELRRMATRQRVYTYIAVVPMVALIALLAPPIVKAFLPQYAPGIPAILVTAMIPLVSTTGEGYGGILHVLSRQYWYIGAILAALVVNVVASLLLVGPFGLVGVAMGTFIAFIVLATSRVVLGSLALKRAVSA